MRYSDSAFAPFFNATDVFGKLRVDIPIFLDFEHVFDSNTERDE
jgi:hypothetical protein